MITYNGTNLAFSPADVPAKALDARHVHRSGYWWTPRLQGKPTRDLLRKAQDRGVETSLDVSTDPEGWPDSRRAKVLAVLPEVSIFFGNEEEVCGVFGVRSLGSAAKEALRLGVEILAVHQGANGCVGAAKGEHHRTPAFSVVPRNPTGSGDSVNAGFVCAWFRARDLRRC